MLPIMMATLFNKRPNVAVNIDKIVMKKKSCLGELPLINLSTASDLSLLVRVLKRMSTITCKFKLFDISWQKNGRGAQNRRPRRSRTARLISMGKPTESRGAQNRTGVARTPCVHSTTEPHPAIMGVHATSQTGLARLTCCSFYPNEILANFIYLTLCCSNEFRKSRGAL